MATVVARTQTRSKWHRESSTKDTERKKYVRGLPYYPVSTPHVIWTCDDASDLGASRPDAGWSTEATPRARVDTHHIRRRIQQLLVTACRRYSPLSLSAALSCCRCCCRFCRPACGRSALVKRAHPNELSTGGEWKRMPPQSSQRGGVRERSRRQSLSAAAVSLAAAGATPAPLAATAGATQDASVGPRRCDENPQPVRGAPGDQARVCRGR